MKGNLRLAGVRLAVMACLMACSESLRAYDWLPPTNKIVLLAVWTHPDDEGIFGGGTLPYYSSVLKVPTMLVCMTYGWGDQRENELRCATWTYGLRYAPLFGGFTDIESNLATNNPYTNTIDMTWDYWAGVGFKGDGSDVEAGKERAINYVAEQIRRYRPDVIITHDLNGETGHDNHKATAYAVTHAFYVAADPNAAATNLVGLPPWQAQKLYVHLYSTNRLFHTAWESPCSALTNQTAHQLVNEGLTCHVSQGPARWTCASVYPPAGMYTSWPSEWWGLYASVVGPDTVLSSNFVAYGYTVPAGVAAGGLLEHISLGTPNRSAVFATPTITLPTAATYDSYAGQSLRSYILAAGSAQVLTFSKISGPAWLDVASDGTLSGTSSQTDAGTNTWVVGVTDGAGAPDQATVSIFLVPRALGQENLVGWWKLSETNPASPVASNSAPASPNGVCYGGVTFGQSGARPWTHGAAQFDGTDGKIDVPYSAALNPPVFTAALWANVSGGSGTYRSPLTSRQSVPQAGYMFYAANNNVWQFRIGSGSAWNILNSGPVAPNTWIHLAATYDGTTACLYTNGVLAGSMNVTFQPNHTFPLRIGAGASESAGAYWFPGLVNDVRVYREALDPAHIRALCANPPSVGSIKVSRDGTAQVQGSGLAGESYILLASSDPFSLGMWTPVATNLADLKGQLLFVDPWASTHSLRFYRIVLP